MTIWIPKIEHISGPRYLAIAEALGEDLASGRVTPGSRLPTHRDLAEHLGLTVGTITRAYAEAARRGFISGEVGRGTFARHAPGESPAMSTHAASSWIDLSMNLPPVSPEEERGLQLSQTLAAISKRAELGGLLAYPPESGDPSHRAAGASWIQRLGLDAPRERVLLTNGNQHGMTAALSALLRPGDLLLTESLTYPGVKALANLFRLRLQGLPMDEHGLLPEALQSLCRSGGAKALYCTPTLHNPTAAVMPLTRRREIAALCRAHNILLLEDDVYGPLIECAPPPISSLMPELSIFLASTSKSIAPGLRVGFMLAPTQLLGRLAAGIRATTWMAAPLMVEITATWLRDGTADALLAQKRRETRARQQLAASLLAPAKLQTSASAYHLWLHLPEPWRSEGFAHEAKQRGVLVTSSSSFFVGRGTPPDAVRICLGAARDRAQLEEGLACLASLLAGSPEPELLAP